MAKRRTQEQWREIELDWGSDKLSNRDLATKYAGIHGIPLTETAIRKQAKKEDWKKDLSTQIMIRRDQLMQESQVEEVQKSTKAVEEKEVVEINASHQVGVLKRHQKMIGKAQGIVEKLLAELEATTVDNELFLELGYFLRDESDKGADKRNDLYNGIISMAGRIKSVKELSEAMTKLVNLERVAHGIKDDAGDDKGSLEDFLSKLDD